MPECPLCHFQQTTLFSADPHREYWRCKQCRLVFVPANQHLSPVQEQQHYLLHNNTLTDPGYRRFLERLVNPLLATLGLKNLTGLDFGCGPGPLLAQMCREAGHQMHIWDPFFANEPAVLQRQYDFISCTEAIEHFVKPANEWQLWLNLLKPGGVLAIMTSHYVSQQHFANWHYKRDPTHISFFCADTFRFLAQRDQMSLSFPVKDVVLLRKAG